MTQCVREVQSYRPTRRRSSNRRCFFQPTNNRHIICRVRFSLASIFRDAYNHLALSRPRRVSRFTKPTDTTEMVPRNRIYDKSEVAQMKQQRRIQTVPPIYKTIPSLMTLINPAASWREVSRGGVLHTQHTHIHTVSR